jgi:ketosteroid isomerase-like protein
MKHLGCSPCYDSRMRIPRSLGLVFLSVMLALIATADAPGETAVPSATLPPELDRVLRDYERAWTGRDPEALSQLFTEDGFVLSNGKPPVRGRAAIREAYAKAGGALALRVFSYSVDGSTGYIIGAYAGAKDGPDIGKFVLALRKGAGGRWLIAADIDNTNASRQAPPQPQP